MSSPADIHQTLATLERLKSVVAELAAREDALNRDEETRRASALKARDYHAKQRATELAAQLTAAEADRETARAQARARATRLSERLDRARRALLKQGGEEITREEDREKYLYQKRMLDAERLRQSDTSKAAGDRERFQKEAAASEEKFVALEYSASNAFYFSSEFRGLLSPSREWPVPDCSPDERELLAKLGALYAETHQTLRRFRRNPLIGIFRLLPVWLLIGFELLAYAAVVLALPYYGMRVLPVREATYALAGALAGTTLLYQLAKAVTRSQVRRVAENLAKARHWHGVCLEKAGVRFQQEEERSALALEATARQLQEQWERASEEVARKRAALPAQVEERMARAKTRETRLRESVLGRIDREHDERVAAIRDANERVLGEKAGASQATLTQIEETVRQERRALQQEWMAAVRPLWAELEAVQKFARGAFPEWTGPAPNAGPARDRFIQTARIGEIDVDLPALAGVHLEGRTLEFPGPRQFSVPLLLRFPQHGALLLETSDLGKEEAANALNALVFELLALVPPGKAAFTLIDPVGLGQTFAGLMHLADYEEGPIQGRVWTQSTQIEERLGELNEHMEKVIQMYLRNEYATIAEYNERAGVVAEKYQFLVIAGFPANFSELAGRRLLNIIASGARCGVYTFIQWDRRIELPHGFIADDLRKDSVRLLAERHGFVAPGYKLPGTKVRLEIPPEPGYGTEFLHEVGERTKDSNRVELPFDQVAPSEAERWSQDAGEEVRVPIGRSGATKLQYLALGRGTRQHALIAGKTGSGKSTLFHVLITNVALWYSPEQVEFYLVDFKKGVEFKVYANQRLPHARVVAIESDREFGLSVLQRIDEELRRRGDLFRRADAQDLAGFRRARPDCPLPRLLLLIDEFQEFFTEEDRISQAAAVLLDRIVRQGRAFGVHVVLGSQTLGGAYTLARATMGQMVVRIALQTNEADAYLIMDENNAAPRLLSRPGEGIYNDLAGAAEANSPFQTAWLPDDAREEYLRQVRALAERGAGPVQNPIVFEGNAPAEIRENEPLLAALNSVPTLGPEIARIWLGAPNSIKGPSEATLARQSGANLLVVGQGEEATQGMPAMALVSLSAQFPVGGVRLVFLDSSAPGSPERDFFDQLLQILPHPVERPKRGDVVAVINELAQEILQREQGGGGIPTFLVIAGLQDFKSLRPDDEFSFSSAESGAPPNAAASLGNLITEGPGRAGHVIATIDTQANVSRFLGRKALAEFHWRVLFQMSASDSASLIDSPEAGKLGLHRALLYNEREGYVEKFRPYALGSREWMRDVAALLRRRASSTVGALADKT